MPAALARSLPDRLRPLGLVLAFLARPAVRPWAALLGFYLRRRPPLDPGGLSFLYPVWLEVGRYCGWT